MKRNKAIAFLILVFLLLLGIFYKMLNTPRETVPPSIIPGKRVYSFRIQILTSKIPIKLNSQVFKGYTVNEEKDGNLYKYSTGEFSDKANALSYRKKLIKDGFEGSFVVTYINGKRQPVKNAQTDHLKTV
jgi:hypothetical protein